MLSDGRLIWLYYKSTCPPSASVCQEGFDAISHVKVLVEWHGRAKLTICHTVLLSEAFSFV